MFKCFDLMYVYVVRNFLLSELSCFNKLVSAKTNPTANRKMVLRDGILNLKEISVSRELGTFPPPPPVWLLLI